MKETIYALVTKPINQNVAIIRISGPKAFGAAISLYNNKIKPKEGTVIFKKLFLSNVFVDDTLVLFFKSPNSFTGEDVVEIQSHGSMFVVQKILDELKKTGIRHADRGEFSKQAFLNKKMDLFQAEAINVLINSENKKLANLASKSLNGQQTKMIEKHFNFIKGIVAQMKVHIDYPEDPDLPPYDLITIKNELRDLLKQFIKLVEVSKNIVKIAKGIVVTIIGWPNAGKSSLMNTLLQEERVIVSEQEGTTRDAIEASFILDDFKITLIDTAGLRKTIDEIEKKGIDKALFALKQSHFVLLLIDTTRDIQKQKEYFKDIIDEFKEKIIIVYAKKDLSKYSQGVSISSYHNDLTMLFEELRKKLNKTILDFKQEDFLLSNQQIEVFESVLENLTSTIKLIENQGLEDLIISELEEVLKNLGKILGIYIDIEYMTNLFSTFCIGK